MVPLEAHWTALQQNGLMGRMKPFPEARDPVVVVGGGRVVVWLVVVIVAAVVSQQVRVEVTEEEPSCWCDATVLCHLIKKETAVV